jgi:hypothetical protein
MGQICKFPYVRRYFAAEGFAGRAYAKHAILLRSGIMPPHGAVIEQFQESLDHEGFG